MTTEHGDDALYAEDQAYFLERREGMTLGRALRAHRLGEGMTQAACAVLLGINKQLLSEYERGLKVPSYRKAYDIALKLGIAPEIAIELAVNDQLKRDAIPVRLANVG